MKIQEFGWYDIVWPDCEFYLTYWPANVIIEEFGWYDSLAGMRVLPETLIPAKMDGRYERYHNTKTK